MKEREKEEGKKGERRKKGGRKGADGGKEGEENITVLSSTVHDLLLTFCTVDCNMLERARLLSGRNTRTWRKERERGRHCSYSTEASLMVVSPETKLGFVFLEPWLHQQCRFAVGDDRSMLLWH